MKTSKEILLEKLKECPIFTNKIEFKWRGEMCDCQRRLIMDNYMLLLSPLGKWHDELYLLINKLK